MGSELQVKFLEVDEVRCGLRSTGVVAGPACAGYRRSRQGGDEQGTPAACATWAHVQLAAVAPRRTDKLPE